MGILNFKKAQTRDDILGIISAALRQNDECTVMQQTLSLVAQYKNDPQIVQPVAGILNHYVARKQPYIVATLAGQITDQADPEAPLYKQSLDTYFQAMVTIGESNPLTALQGYTIILQKVDPASPVVKQAYEQVAKISAAPEPIAATALLEGLYELSDVLEEDSAERHAMQDNILNLADAIRPHMAETALDAYTFVLDQVAYEDPRKQDLVAKLLSVTETIAERNDEMAGEALALILKCADEGSFTYISAQRLQQKITKALTIGEYPDAKPVNPQAFALLHSAGFIPQ